MFFFRQGFVLGLAVAGAISIQFEAATGFEGNPDQSRFVFIGDSLTQGYGVKQEQAFPALLVERLNEKQGSRWIAVNAGVSGALSAEGPARVRWQLKGKPKAVMVALGANDGLQGLAPKKLKSNLAATLDELLKARIPTFFCGMKMVKNLGDRYVNDFESVYSDLANDYRLRFSKAGVEFGYDPFLLDGVALVAELNISDGRHPNEKGHRFIADRLYQKVQEFALKAAKRGSDD